MLGKMSDALAKKANGKNVLILLIIYLLYSSLMFWAGSVIKAYSEGVGPIDLKLFYSPETAYQMMASYKESGRELYKTIELTVDVVFPVINALFFSLLITYFLRRALRSEGVIQKLNLLPFITLLFDYLENAGIVTMLLCYPGKKLTTVAQVTSTFTILKWVMAGATLVVTLIGLAAFCFKKVVAREKWEPKATKPE